jgi:hypothetical protein
VGEMAVQPTQELYNEPGSHDLCLLSTCGVLLLRDGKKAIYV